MKAARPAGREGRAGRAMADSHTAYKEFAIGAAPSTQRAEIPATNPPLDRARGDGGHPRKWLRRHHSWVRPSPLDAPCCPRTRYTPKWLGVTVDITAAPGQLQPATRANAEL